jgi:hypothetical protein
MNRLLLLSVVFSSFFFSAQAQVGFGIEAGFNVSDYTLKTNDNTKPTDPKLGGRLGIISDIGITDNFYFQPGLHYVTNGYKAFITNGYEQFILNTVELPLNIQYKFGALGNNRLYVGIGPYFAWNKDGYYRVFVNKFVDSRSDLRIGNGATDVLRSFDFGGGVNGGYQITEGLYVRVRAQMGFVDLLPGNNANTSARSVGYSISGGYIFYKKDNRGRLKIYRKRDSRKERMQMRERNGNRR